MKSIRKIYVCFYKIDFLESLQSLCQVAPFQNQHVQ